MRSIRATIRTLGLTEALMRLETRPAHKRAAPRPASAESVLSNAKGAHYAKKTQLNKLSIIQEQ